MHLIDTHCHLTFEPLSQDIQAVVGRSIAAGVIGWITVGTDLDHSRRAVDLASRFAGMSATIGIHPHEAGSATIHALRDLKAMARSGPVVAVGETGLDFHYNLSPPHVQQEVFVRHLDMAMDLGLPVVVHTREAFEQTLEVLDRYPGLIGVVLHCFTGSQDQVRKAVDRGYYVSFTGVITFKNAGDLREAAKIVPMDRLLVETDCPYIAPVPMRRQKANEPSFMIHTARALAELRGLKLDDLAQTTTANALRLFGQLGGRPVSAGQHG